MASLIIEKYISANYSRWLRRVRNLCYRYEIREALPEDLLQDAMCVVFSKRSSEDIVYMMHEIVHQRYTLLDIFVSRIIRYRVFSASKHQSVVSRKVVRGLDLNIIEIEEIEPTTHYDVFEYQRQLSKVINVLNIDEKARCILLWKLVCNSNIQDLGINKNKTAKLYNDGLSILKQTISNNAATI